MLVTATPWALFWPAAMIVWGPGLTCATHRHHAIQLVMALTGTVRIRSGPDQRWRRCAAALVRPDAPHEVDAGGAQILFAFVESESDLGAALLERVSASIDFIDEATVKTWRNDLGEVSTLTSERVEPWLRTHLLSGRQTPKIHPKVRRALQELRQELASTHKFPLDHLARVAELSPSRFMHVFTESVGVPLRPYILWLRLQRACSELMNGANVTDAALRSGFSDAPHLTRTMRRMLGITPGHLVRRRPTTQAASAESSADAISNLSR
jgi:AraC-like DNA-binding protein